MKKIFFDEQGNVIQRVLLLVTWISIILFFTIKLFLSGHIFWGIVLILLFLIPSILASLKTVFGIDIEKRINKKIETQKKELIDLENKKKNN